jgi:o-succinylbenzoate synthase
MQTAHGVMAQREGALLEIHTPDGLTGWGEIAPLPEFGGGTLKEALNALRDMHLESGSVLPMSLHRLPNSLACGLESALLDIFSQRVNCSLCAWLANWVPTSEKGFFGIEGLFPAIDFFPKASVARFTIPVNAVCGASNTEAAIQQALTAITNGYTCVKLKVGIHSPQADIERVQAVRAAIGPAIQLRLDANAAWNYEAALTVLQACESCDIQYVEQPLPAADLAGMRRLRQATTIPLAADEAISDRQSALRVLQEEAADIFVLKPQMLGGLLATRRIIVEAASRGIQTVVTSSMETGVGVVGTLHLVAALPQVSQACGLGTLGLLEDDLLLDPPMVSAGMMSVPQGPGLGVQIDRIALERWHYEL